MSLEPQPESQTGQADRRQIAIASSNDRFTLMDLWRILVKQRFFILAVTVLSVTGAAVYSFRTKPIYESHARIEINPNNMPRVGLQGLGEESDRTSESGSILQTEILVLQSDSVMLQTAQSLNLLSNITGDKSKGGAAAGGELTPWQRLALIATIKGGLRVKLVPGTHMVDIRYRNQDPKLATEVVNKLVDTYIDEDLRSKFDRTMHVSVWLQKQLEDLKQDASDAQRRLADFQREHNIVGTDENSNLTMQNLTQISADMEGAEADRILKEARMREFESQDADLVSLMGDNPDVTALRAQLRDLELQRAQLSLKYGDRHPKIQELDSQIAKTRASINKEVALARVQMRDEYQGALHLEQMMRKRLDAQKEEAYKLNEDVAQYAILRHEAELNRDLYDALQMRLKEASVTAGLAATNITVVDRAQIPIYAVAPQKTMSLLAGLIGGFLGGILLAFIIESIDDRVQTSEEAESVAMLASLATIPHIGGETGNRKREESDSQSASTTYARQLITLHSPKSLAGEAFRGLRSSLLLSSFDRPPRLIAFTSAFPGEGKTTTAVNCAIALAQRGERVLLVDADLRRGSLDRVFNIADRSVGLSTVLRHSPSEGHELSIEVPELPMLHVLPTGPRPPNPAEMLSSHRMGEWLERWAKDFDRVVIDTAPVLAVSDTQAVAANVDSVVLVIRAGVTRKRAIIRSRELLMRINAPLVGFVVNDVDMRLENFYTYRYGMYGYQYGYGYPADPDSTAADQHEDDGEGA
jgi:capsular exopolysaccharide synthesis family protein